MSDMPPTGWTDKTFRVLQPVYDDWKQYVGPKGDQMVVASGSLLMWLRASEEERQEARELVDRLRQNRTTVADIIAGTLSVRTYIASLERRLAAMEAESPEDYLTETTAFKAMAERVDSLREQLDYVQTGLADLKRVQEQRARQEVEQKAADYRKKGTKKPHRAKR